MDHTLKKAAIAVKKKKEKRERVRREKLTEKNTKLALRSLEENLL